MEKMWYSIILIIGLMLLSTAFYFFVKSREFIQTGIKTTAIVSEFIETRGSKNSKLYKPVFEYTTLLNEKIKQTYNVASKPPMWNVGDSVEIIYNPNNPDNMKPVGYFGLYGICVILLSIATPFIVIGAGYFIYTTNLH